MGALHDAVTAVLSTATIPAEASAAVEKATQNASSDESCDAAIKLWNHVVKHRRSIQPENNALARHVCIRIMCKNGSDSFADAMMRLEMASQAAKAWISCGDLAKASTAFDFANDALTHARSCDAVSMTRPQNAEKEYSFWTTRSKAYAMEQNWTECWSAFQKAEAIAPSLGTLVTVQLTQLAHENGMDAVDAEAFEDAASWFTHTVQLCDQPSFPADRKPVLLNRALRLLSYTLQNVKKYDEAINCLDRANIVLPSATGLVQRFLVIRHCQRAHSAAGNLADATDVSEAFMQVVNSPMLDRAANVVSVLKAALETPTVEETVLTSAVQILRERFRGALDVVEVELACLEALDDGGLGVLCASVIDELVDTTLDADQLRQLHGFFSDRAASNFKLERYQASLAWYATSLRFPHQGSLEPSEHLKLLSNAAWSGLLARDFASAVELADQAILVDSSCLRAKYVKFRVHLEQGDSIAATQLLTALGAASNDDADLQEGLISCAVKDAFDNQNRECAVTALEQLCSRPSTAGDCSVQTLRCLLTLLSDAPNNKDATEAAATKATQLGRVVALVEQAAQTLQKSATDGASEEIKSELSWFSKFSWNQAIAASEAGLSKLGSKFFSICLQLDGIHASTESANRRKMCHLMKASAKITELTGLNATMSADDLRTAADEVIDAIRLCRLLIKASLTGTDVQLEKLLITLEFNAFALSKQEPQLRRTLETAARVLKPASYPDVYLALGSIANKMKFFSIGVEAYKSAVLGALEACQGTVAADTRHLALLSSAVQETMTLAGNCADYTTCLQIAELMAKFVGDESRSVNYPADGFEWLVIEVWNCAIDDTVAMSDAEGPSRLCNAAFQLVQLLPEGTKQQLNKELLERYSQLGG